MKNAILFIIAALTFGAVQAQKEIKGNGTMKSITRTTSDYEGIKCAGSFDYVLVSGAEGKITIEGEENLLEFIVTEVKDGYLIVKNKDRINLNSSNNKTIKIIIPFKEINEVSFAGSGDLWSQDKITVNDFKSSLAGSGSMVLHVETTSTNSSLAGSGKMTLKGTTNDLDVSVSGSGKFHGFDLQANNTVISVAGSGDAELFCNGKLKARVAGSGDIKYKGNPKTEETKVAGSGSIESN